MKQPYITHRLERAAAWLVGLVLLTACMSDNKIETTPRCAIVNFAVNSIKSEVASKIYDSEGNASDTTVVRTIAGSGIYFNIDQLKGHIHSIDSLPNWVDLTAVVPTITAYGDVYVQLNEDDELYYPILSGTTAVDFSKTVNLLCVSTDGTSRRTYTVDIYKHQDDTDTLKWASCTTDLAIDGESKPFHIGDKVFVFAKNSANEDVVTYANEKDATQWSTPVSIPVASSSVLLFGNTLYGLGSDGYIYSAATSDNAATWSKASDRQVERLLAADAYNLYAYDGTAIIGSADLTNWTEQGVDYLDMLPETQLFSIAYYSRTNQQLQTAFMAGISSQNSDNGVVWLKTSSAQEGIDQPWTYIQVTEDNPYGLPHFEHLSMTYYDNALIAIGAYNGAYDYLYRSDDNGITWHPQTERYPIPEDLNPANGAASIVAVGDKLWIIQADGEVWEGSIQ